MAANPEEVTKSENTVVQNGRINGRFAPGYSGNPKGKPKSARHTIAEAFLKDFQAAWEEDGPEAIKTLAEKQPAEFVKIAASMVPKEQRLDITELRTFVVELTGNQEHAIIEHEDLPRLEIADTDETAIED